MIALTLAAMLLATPVAAEDVRESCGDDRGRDLCDRAVQEKIRLKVGAEPAEALAGRGLQGVRVFMVNGYGVDQPAVSILWQGSAKPTIETRVDRGEGAPAVLTAEGSAWTRPSTQTLMRLVRQARPQPPKFSNSPAANGERQLVLCMHAWMAVIETLEDGRVRRRVRHACGDDAIFDAAMSFASQAVNASEACRAVRVDGYRNDWERIAACPAIAGPNVRGAAAVFELSSGSPLEEASYPHDPTLEKLAADVTLRSPTEILSGREAVAGAWTRFADGADARHWVRTATGRGTVVQVEGIAIRETDETFCHADSRQEWTRAAGQWRLKSWTLGPCVDIPPASRD